MRQYTADGGLQCYLVVPPTFRPQLFTNIEHAAGANLRCIVQVNRRTNRQFIDLANGRTDVFQLGPPRNDLLLTVTGADRNTSYVIKEIADAGIPVYIYPRGGGGMALNVPLVRGLGTDPLDLTVTNTLAVSAGTTIYMPRADAGKGVYLEPLDLTSPIVPGIRQAGDTWNAIGSHLPLGGGAVFPKKGVNKVLDSMITAITYEVPYAPGTEWAASTSAADVWGTDHGIQASPWLPAANAYWTTSSTTSLRSYAFATGFIVGKLSLSFCYRVDGTMNVAFKTGLGVTEFNINISSGSGRYMVDLNSTGMASGGYLEVKLAAGSYCLFSCPQVMQDGANETSMYMPFLGTSSTTVKAEVTGSGIRVQHDVGADAVPLSGTTAKRDGAMLASCYLEPLFRDGYALLQERQTFLQIIGRDSDIKLNIGDDGGGVLEFALYFGGVRRAGAALTDHRQGDIYAVGVWSGYTDGSAATNFRAIRLRDGQSYAASYFDSLVNGHDIRIGYEASATAQADCIVSGLCIESIRHEEATFAIDRMADATVLNVIKETAGRWYILDDGTSPRPQDGHLNQGQYMAREVRAI